LINSSQTAQWITGGIPKEGSKIKSDVVAAHLLDQLLDYAGRTITSLADRIYAGEISISPFKRGNYTPCQNCPYRPVCRFDPLINRYRKVEPMAGELAIKHMLNEVNPPDGEDEK
jgi:ATP-dependent helicase/nuclease subunit B